MQNKKDLKYLLLRHCEKTGMALLALSALANFWAHPNWAFILLAIGMALILLDNYLIRLVLKRTVKKS